MSDQPTIQGEERRLNDKPFSVMTSSEKMSFLCKALVFFVSGGFIFPTIWTD